MSTLFMQLLNIAFVICTINKLLLLLVGVFFYNRTERMFSYYCIYLPL